ncbi:hypothetical protein QTN25_005766 [Entamoeba marina]
MSSKTNDLFKPSQSTSSKKKRSKRSIKVVPISLQTPQILSCLSSTWLSIPTLTNQCLLNSKITDASKKRIYALIRYLSDCQLVLVESNQIKFNEPKSKMIGNIQQMQFAMKELDDSNKEYEKKIDNLIQQLIMKYNINDNVVYQFHYYCSVFFKRQNAIRWSSKQQNTMNWLNNWKRRIN